jgi:hypothetical protein
MSPGIRRSRARQRRHLTVALHPGRTATKVVLPADEKAAMARMETLVWDHTRTWRQRLGVKRGGKRGLRGAILETPPCGGPRDRPLSLCGPVLHVRKFASVPMTPHDLLAHGTVGPRMLGFLEACVRGRANVVVSARGLFEPLGAALALAGRTGSRGRRSGQDRRYSADVG